jgi:putative transposase
MKVCLLRRSAARRESLGRQANAKQSPLGSQATYFNWKKKYAGMLPPEMKKLKQLEGENARLKRIVADLTLDREMLQDVIRRKL